METVKKAVSAFFDFLQGIVVFMSILVMIYLFIISPQEINGASMEPNFHNAELILTNKIAYKMSDPTRGDVIILKSPSNKDVDYIKRVLGLPGDTIKLSNSVFYVNDQPVAEPYLAPDTVTMGGSFLHEGESIVVEEGKYFVAGDNRQHSSDSREFGTIPFEDIIGKAILRYWPPSKAGVFPHPVYDIK